MPNEYIPVLPSTTQTNDTVTSEQIDNPDGRGLILFLDVTAKSGTGKITQIDIFPSIEPGHSPIHFDGLNISEPGHYSFAIYPAEIETSHWTRVSRAPALPAYLVTVEADADESGNDITYAMQAAHLV